MGFPSAIFALVAPATTSIKSRISAPVKPIEAEDAESLSELSLGNADIAIVQEHSHVEASRQDRFVYHHVRSDPMVIITAESFDHRPTNLSSLSSAAWIVSSAGTPCQESTTVACLLAGFEPNEVAKVDELRNTIALVASMNAVSLVPRLALPDKLDGIRVADIDTGITREIYAVTRASADDRSTGAVIEALARVG